MKKFFEYTFSVLFFGACAIYFISKYDIGSFEEEKRAIVTDRRGNKYEFKDGFISCRESKFSPGEAHTFCNASAIKTDIAGQRYVVEFPERFCTTSVKGQKFKLDTNSLTCEAARKMGKYQTLMNKDGCYSCKYYD